MPLGIFTCGYPDVRDMPPGVVAESLEEGTEPPKECPLRVHPVKVEVG